ncbi:MAG TPA: hypothetical protein VGP72_08115 [Planctomycetota bacterium]
MLIHSDSIRMASSPSSSVIRLAWTPSLAAWASGESKKEKVKRKKKKGKRGKQKEGRLAMAFLLPFDFLLLTFIV